MSAKVAIFMGSISDKDTMQPCSDLLTKLGIPHVFTVSSAHRTPERTAKLVKELEDNGCEIFICAAGLAAHLAGAVAAKTIRPVLGVPICGSALSVVWMHCWQRYRCLRDSRWELLPSIK